MTADERIDAPPAPVRTNPRQRFAVAVLLTANFTLAVDFSVLNVALPHIGRDLGFATADLQWIITAFSLCAAGSTLFFGRVADLFGRKRLFLIGIVVLGVASLVAGVAGTPAVLIGARIGQGIATAMVTPAALALLTTMFAEGPGRARVLGLSGALMAAGFTTGAALGGVLTGLVSWRWAFFINVIVAVFVLVVAPFVLTDRAVTRRPTLDLPGAVVVTVALVALVFGITTAGQSGWFTPTAWGPIVAAVVLFAVFIVIESRVAEPLVSPALLRRSNVAWGNVAGLLAFATETALVFPLTLYLQEILGFTAVIAGLVFAFLGVGTVLGGFLGPRVIGRVDAKRAIVIGFVVQGAATLPLAFVSDSSVWVIPLLVVTFIGGAANLVAIVGYTVTSTAGVPLAEQGLATGLITMSQQVGITLGTPVLSAIVTASAGATLLPGIQASIGVDAALCIAGAIVVGLLVRLPTVPAAPRAG
ncbi:MFS transporter [Curtobacterium herbarum]|uniref:MFS transporter n=1 Tax=Curtobacterium herbarum TaxID=150122 RepID=A0ABP4K4E4_9MICO|nr:MFS transporter [Curtobacterium herbarum]MBM7476891.1 EmrB/QacA subfamily drug resistance transporter [Curtobacterium herbarum]MCS6545098.1 MFS transporter [Curtobacterium herbarum]